MYLSIGNDMAVRETSIVGIFDLDNTTTSVRTREFLARAEEQGEVTPCDELPKSFLLCQSGGVKRVYVSHLAPSTLRRRAENTAASLR